MKTNVDMASVLAAIIDEPINSIEKIRRIAHALKGGRTDAAFTAFVNRSSSLDRSLIGFWTSTKQRFRPIPETWISAICDAYKKAGAPIDLKLIERMKIVRRQAHEELTCHISHMFKPPKPSQGVSPFSFCLVCTEIEMNPFVTLSENEAAIRDAHGWLKPSDRRALYRRWFARAPRSFLYLAHSDVDNGTLEPIAVSILLPLSARGHERIWKRETDAVGLNDDEISGSGDVASALLLDTWIVKPKPRKRRSSDRVPRMDHKGFAGAMLSLHVGMFWDGKSELSILVEPDNDKITRYCRALRLQPSDDNKCFRLQYVPSMKFVPQSWTRLMGYVAELRNHPVEGLRAHVPPS